MFNKLIDEEGVVVTRVERQRMLEQIMDEILGFGPIQPLLNDDTITEIMVNGPFRTTGGGKGRRQLSAAPSATADKAPGVLDRIIRPTGRASAERKPSEA